MSRSTVTSAASPIETTSGVIRETIDRVRVSELPLNGRNVLQLQLLVPGVVSAGSLDQGAGTPGFAVNGGISSSNMYSLDGAEYQDAYFNAPLPFPNPDALQEFTIQTNAYSAEFGRNRGASVNAVTKSGANEFHGGAYEFVRNDIFDARRSSPPRSRFLSAISSAPSSADLSARTRPSSLRPGRARMNAERPPPAHPRC